MVDGTKIKFLLEHPLDSRTQFVLSAVPNRYTTRKQTG